VLGPAGDTLLSSRATPKENIATDKETNTEAAPRETSLKLPRVLTPPKKFTNRVKDLVSGTHPNQTDKEPQA
jgi:hypothetical protein